MITDQFNQILTFLLYTFEQVKQDKTDDHICSESVIFCGLRDILYPDKRSMGFPFDRSFDSSVSTIEDLVNDRNNMFNRFVSIRHINEIARFRNIDNLNVVSNPTNDHDQGK